MESHYFKNGRSVGPQKQVEGKTKKSLNRAGLGKIIRSRLRGVPEREGKKRGLKKANATTGGTGGLGQECILKHDGEMHQAGTCLLGYTRKT